PREAVPAPVYTIILSGSLLHLVKKLLQQAIFILRKNGREYRKRINSFQVNSSLYNTKNTFLVLLRLFHSQRTVRRRINKNISKQKVPFFMRKAALS
ncbi:MAG: hypothetical protein MRZ91_05610, partial [Christensenellaceae bacterium]|nr:hypothetical protein [Christensenellaceae bacterium]